jgi:hypothetical protein
MDVRARKTPYIHISSLAKLFADPDGCGYGAQFKANYIYRRAPFENAGWLADHGALVARLAAQHEALGYRATCEDANSFQFTGPRSGTTVAGRPDILAIDREHSHGLIDEAKTGAPRTADTVQA